MEDSDDKIPKVKLSEIAEITSTALALTILFQLIRNYVFYTLFLHIPIFQYIDMGDLPLLAPTFLWWILYYGAVQAAAIIQESKSIPYGQRLFYTLLMYGFAIYLTIIGFRNDPIIKEGIELIKYAWWWIVPLLATYVAIRVVAKNKNTDIFEKYKMIGIFLLVIWWSTYDSLSSYLVIKKGTEHVHYVLKLKSGQHIKLGDCNIYVGRTKSYWFYYNKLTGFTRAIKNDDVDQVDFDSVNE